MISKVIIYSLRFFDSHLLFIQELRNTLFILLASYPSWFVKTFN